MRFLFVIICLLFASNSFSQDWREELNLARSFYKLKKYKEAYSKYILIDKIKPKNIDLKTEIAQAAYKAQQFDSSITNYKKSLKSNKINKSDIHYNIGNSFFNKGDFSNAIESYKKALRSRPNDEQVRHNLTLALKKQNKNKPQNQPEDNQDNKNQPKQQPNPKENDKKKQENQPSPEQSMQKDRTERMLDELMKQEMKAKQNKNKSNTSNNSNNNGKDW